MKTLIVRLSAIGDVVHTLPAAAALKRRGHDVDWLVEPRARPLVEKNPAVTTALPAPPARLSTLGGASATARELRRARYDAALDLQGLWKSAAWARVSGARKVIGFAGPWRREPLSELLIRTRIQLASEPGLVIDKNLALLRALEIDAVGSREFPLPPSPAQSKRVGEELASRGWPPSAERGPSRASCAAPITTPPSTCRACGSRRPGPAPPGRAG